MLRLVLFAPFMLLPVSAMAQSEADQPLQDSISELGNIIRKASRNELYLIDEVAQTCKRITSGLKQRDAIYFKTSENTESSELFLDGQGALRFNVKGSAAVDCGVSNEVAFRISSSDRDTWQANYASSYCVSALVFDNCSHSCNEYAEIGSRKIIFANGRKTASEISSSLGGGMCRD